MVMIQGTNKTQWDLHSTFNTGSMIAEGTAENSVELVHTLLRRGLSPRLPFPHVFPSAIISQPANSFWNQKQVKKAIHFKNPFYIEDKQMKLLSKTQQ